jgi:pyrimidine operon attenuation protein/uracil phosphoribosyltransferase
MNVSVPSVIELQESLVQSIRGELTRRNIIKPALIGIHSGGKWLAEWLHQRLALTEPMGALDISFYRDDFSTAGMNPRVKPSSLPFKVEGRDILLVDDIFFTGRTARAALNEIFDYGRPASVLLAVLLERNGREVPIRPDCRGGVIELQRDQKIKLQGPVPLGLTLVGGNDGRQ